MSKFAKLPTPATAGLIVLMLAGCASGPPPLPAELQQRLATATSTADHMAVASAFEREAAAARQEVARHERMARLYPSAPYDKARASMTLHCREQMRRHEALAVDYDGKAIEHRRMAERAPS